MDRMVEECSEVIGAIMKYKKHKNEGWGDLVADVKHIEDELGDLRNVFEQMALIFSTDNIRANASAKLLRLKGRIIKHNKAKQLKGE